MIFKKSIVAELILLLCFSCMGRDPQDVVTSIEGVALPRPLILRSDFVAKDVLRTLMIRSKFTTPESMAKFIGNNPGIGRNWFSMDYVKECRRFVKHELNVAPTPKLKGGTLLPVAEGFDRFGGSRFPKDAIIAKKKIHFWEHDVVSTSSNPNGYRDAMQKYYTKDVAKRPDFYKGKFSDEYIEKCCAYDKVGKYVKTNPIAANGEMCEFHHNVATKEIQVMTRTNHRLVNSLPSKGHASGTKFAGGGDMTWGQKPPPSKVWSATALRWGGVAGIDLIMSSAALFASEGKTRNDYIANTGSIAAAYLSATITESLIVNTFALSAGTTPAYFGSFTVGVGGFASWVATGVYFVMRTAIMYGWKQYQLDQAIRVENACKSSEQKLRRLSLSEAMRKNTQRLSSIIGS